MPEVTQRAFAGHRLFSFLALRAPGVLSSQVFCERADSARSGRIAIVALARRLIGIAAAFYSSAAYELQLGVFRRAMDGV